jgi:choline kinase
MKRSRVILLAAGQGSRLGDITNSVPKCLLPIRDEPLLIRTVRQLVERDFEEIVIVVGHLRTVVIEAFGALWGNRVRFVVNPAYATDTNIGSLLRGLENLDSSALIIEADVIFDDQAMNAVAAVASRNESVWFTNGRFQSWQIGGILRSDTTGAVREIAYTSRYSPDLHDAKKLLGVLHVGSAEMPRFHSLVRNAAAASTAQYYMMPWVEHLSELPCCECDLGAGHTASFNTPHDYQRCLLQFAHDLEGSYVR